MRKSNPRRALLAVACLADAEGRRGCDVVLSSGLNRALFKPDDKARHSWKVVRWVLHLPPVASSCSTDEEEQRLCAHTLDVDELQRRLVGRSCNIHETGFADSTDIFPSQIRRYRHTRSIVSLLPACASIPLRRTQQSASPDL
jgi:hypothetical protein